jgi:hypothetical protein
MFPGLIQHSVANLPSVPIRFNNPSSEIHPASITGDVVSRHLEEQLPPTLSRSKAHAFDLSARTSGAQHSEIALRVELWRDRLANGELVGLIADRSLTVVQRDAVDRGE